MENPEFQNAPLERDSQSRGKTVVPRSQGSHQGGHLLDHAIGAASIDEQQEGASRLLRNALLSGAGNGPVRARAFRQAQQTYGNSFVKRAVAQQIESRPDAPKGSLGTRAETGGTAESEKSKPQVTDSPPMIGRKPRADRDATAVVGLSSDPSAEPERHESLDSEKAQNFGQALDADFGGVRIHTGDAVAHDHGAAAITFGRDIHFADGMLEARHGALLGHELVHTVQQGAVPVRENVPKEIGTKTATEAEAEQLGPAAARGQPGTVRYSAPEARMVAVRSNVPAGAADTLAAVDALQTKSELNARPSARIEIPGVVRGAAASSSNLESGTVPASNKPQPLPAARPAGSTSSSAPSMTRRPSSGTGGAPPAPVGRGVAAGGLGKAKLPLPNQPGAIFSTGAVPGMVRVPPRQSATFLSGAVPGPGISPTTSSASLGSLLIAEAGLLAGKVRQSSAAAARSIRASAQAQITRLRAEGIANAAALGSHLIHGQAAVDRNEQTAVEKIQESQRTAHADLSSAKETGIAQMQKGGAKEREGASQAGNQASSEFDGAREMEIGRFRKESDARAAQAQSASRAEGDSAAAQAEAAEKIGNQATLNFRKDTANVEEQTQSALGGFGGRIQQSVSDFLGAIENTVSQLTSGITSLVDAVQSGFGETAVRASHNVSTFGAQVSHALANGIAGAQDDLNRGVEATVLAIQTGTEHYVAQVESRGDELAKAMEERAYAVSVAIASMSAEGARKASDEVLAQLRDAAMQAERQLGSAEALVSRSIVQHVANAGSEMAQATAQAGAEIQAAAAQAGQKLSKANEEVREQLAAGAKLVRQQVQQSAGEATNEIGQHGANFRDRIGQGAGQARQQLAVTFQKATNDQQANLGAFESRKSSAATQINAQYSGLKSEAESRSKTEKNDNASQGQALLDWILPASWTAAIKKWFADRLGKWLTGFLYGVIDGLLGVLIVVGIAAVAALIFGPIGAAVVVIVALLAGVGLGIYSRFKMFEAYNGRGPGLGEGIVLVLLGILDVTGLPQIIEGIVGYRAFSNGHKMEDFEAGEAVGSGIVQLIAILLALRGAKGAGKPPDIKPPDIKPPDIKPPEPKPPEPEPPGPKPFVEIDPKLRTDAELVQDLDPTPRPGETPEQARARSDAARAEQARRSVMPVCFVAGTPVQTPDGPMPIEMIERSQLVLSKGEDQPVGAYRVLDLIRGSTRQLYQIEVGNCQTLLTTRNHPFFVAGKGWIIAKDLKVGDDLVTLDDTQVQITAIDRKRLGEPVATFNIHVEIASSYFVGESLAVWVHNSGPNDPVYKEQLYWGFGASGPRERVPDPADPTKQVDFDGASSWGSESSEEAGRFLGVRARQGKLGNHGAMSNAQLAEKGLVAVETPGDDPELVAAGLKHYSIRPSTNPDPNVKLTDDEMKLVDTKLKEITNPAAKTKPKEFGCG